MNEKIEALRQRGYPVARLVPTEALRVGHFLHRNGTLFLSPELLPDAHIAWPEAVEEPVFGLQKVQA